MSKPLSYKELFSKGTLLTHSSLETKRRYSDYDTSTWMSEIAWTINKKCELLPRTAVFISTGEFVNRFYVKVILPDGRIVPLECACLYRV